MMSNHPPARSPRGVRGLQLELPSPVFAKQSRDGVFGDIRGLQLDEPAHAEVQEDRLGNPARRSTEAAELTKLRADAAARLGDRHEQRGPLILAACLLRSLGVLRDGGECGGEVVPVLAAFLHQQNDGGGFVYACKQNTTSIQLPIRQLK